MTNLVTSNLIYQTNPDGNDNATVYINAGDQTLVLLLSAHSTDFIAGEDEWNNLSIEMQELLSEAISRVHAIALTTKAQLQELFPSINYVNHGLSFACQELSHGDTLDFEPNPIDTRNPPLHLVEMRSPRPDTSSTPRGN